jgi:hypothetical protein
VERQAPPDSRSDETPGSIEDGNATTLESDRNGLKKWGRAIAVPVYCPEIGVSATAVSVCPRVGCQESLY